MQSITLQTHEALNAALPWMAADIGVIIALGDGRIEYANPLAEQLLGDVRLAGTGLQDLVWLLGEEYQRVARRVITRLGSPQAQPVRNAVMDLEQASGRRRLRIDVLANGFVDGQPRWLLLLLDLGAVDSGKSLHSTFRQLMDATSVGICMTSEGGRIEYGNPALLRLLGYSGEALIGRSFTCLAPAGSHVELARWVRTCITTGEAQRGELSLVNSEGAPCEVLVETCRISGADGRYRAITFIVDITQRKALESELRDKNRALARMAAADSLTGLYNRRRTLEVLRKILRTANRYDRPLVLAMIDLDDFKAVNDQHGHAVGDEVLVAFSRLLKAASRKSDSVGRIGGEEFLLIMPESDSAGACGLLDRLREECIALGFSVPGLRINFSAGVYNRQAGDDAAVLLRRADQALYAAKRQGRGRECVWPAE